MTPPEQFLKFAADCKLMAKVTDDPKSKPIWHSLAERWTRCAEWAERQSLAAQQAHFQKRNRESKHRFSG